MTLELAHLPTSGVDRDAAIAGAAQLLRGLGADLDREGMERTPARLVDALLEMTTPRAFELTTFPNEEQYDELVLVRDIRFASLCEHHVLPFTGVAHVGYLPSDRIVGLSKLARAVEHASRGLQVQERITVQIADLLERELRPRGVGVVLEAEHLCMSLRGATVPGSATCTSALRGLLRDDARSRQEFLSLTGSR
jgi:GTP cyclohydrolase I